MITIIGLSIIFTGVLVWVIMGAVLYGVDGGTGMFTIAENSLNVTSHTSYQTVKTIWHLVPIGIMISGLLFMLVWSQRQQPYYQERRI